MRTTDRDHSEPSRRHAAWRAEILAAIDAATRCNHAISDQLPSSECQAGSPGRPPASAQQVHSGHAGHAGHALALQPGLHEWFDGRDGDDAPASSERPVEPASTGRPSRSASRAPPALWLPPLAILIDLAWRAISPDPYGGIDPHSDPDRHDTAPSYRNAAADSPRNPHGIVVWVGRACWPYPHALLRRDPAHPVNTTTVPMTGTSGTPGMPGTSDGADRRLLNRSVFVDPATPAERVWAVELALRCSGVAAVIADGTALSMAESRRLQLAASSTGDAPTMPGIQRGANVTGRDTEQSANSRFHAAPNDEAPLELDAARDHANELGHGVAAKREGVTNHALTPNQRGVPNNQDAPKRNTHAEPAPTSEHSGDSVVARAGAERPDVSSRGASTPDAFRRDASTPDASTRDASTRDASTRDAFSRDALSQDVFTRDASSRASSGPCVPPLDLSTRDVSPGTSSDTARGMASASPQGGAIAWLVRPGRERRTLSAARTRWLVTPAPSPDHEQAWMLELLRCKGLQPWTGGARRWSVRRDNATGTLGEWETCDVGLAPAVVDRPRPQAGPKIA